jgi:hypothetical protein
MKKRKNHKYGRHHVRRLMRLIRLVSIYQKPNTSKKTPTTQDMALFAEKCRDQPSEPGLVRGYHGHPDAARLPLSCGDH